MAGEPRGRVVPTNFYSYIPSLLFVQYVVVVEHGQRWVGVPARHALRHGRCVRRCLLPAVYPRTLPPHHITTAGFIFYATSRLFNIFSGLHTLHSRTLSIFTYLVLRTLPPACSPITNNNYQTPNAKQVSFAFAPCHWTGFSSSKCCDMDNMVVAPLQHSHTFWFFSGFALHISGF